MLSLFVIVILSFVIVTPFSTRHTFKRTLVSVKLLFDK